MFTTIPIPIGHPSTKLVGILVISSISPKFEKWWPVFPPASTALAGAGATWGWNDQPKKGKQPTKLYHVVSVIWGVSRISMAMVKILPKIRWFIFNMSKVCSVKAGIDLDDIRRTNRLTQEKDRKWFFRWSVQETPKDFQILYIYICIHICTIDWSFPTWYIGGQYLACETIC